MKKFKDIPWEKKEKIYIIVLVISILTNVFCAISFIYTYKIIADCMTVV